MIDEINSFYDLYSNSTQELFLKINNWAKELKEKEKKINELLLEIMKKEEDMANYKKVSFIAKMNKTIEEKNNIIKIQEDRIRILTEKLNTKTASKKISDDESMFLDSEEEPEINYEKIKYKDKIYLLNNDTKNIFNTDNTMKPLKKVGKLNKKGKIKFKKNI